MGKKIFYGIIIVWLIILTWGVYEFSHGQYLDYKAFEWSRKTESELRVDVEQNRSDIKVLQEKIK